MKKIRMIKQEEIYPGSTLYEISNLDHWFVGGSGAVTIDGGLFKATIYELGDTPMYSAGYRVAIEIALSRGILHV